MQINTEIINIRITKEQKQTLDKLKGYNVNVSQFVRNAIKEKIKKDYKSIIDEFEKSKNYCPF
jgi:post-segregation antitoxin (ccd killing protein)